MGNAFLFKVDGPVTICVGILSMNPGHPAQVAKLFFFSSAKKKTFLKSNVIWLFRITSKE